MMVLLSSRKKVKKEKLVRDSILHSLLHFVQFLDNDTDESVFIDDFLEELLKELPP
jgi:hypothetical protein